MPTPFQTPNGERMIILPEAEYLELLRQAGGEVDLPASVLDETDLVDAETFVAKSIGEDLRAARMAAGLTQKQLATHMKKSQAMISAAERGTSEVGSKYVERLLAACHLPPDWRPNINKPAAPATAPAQPKPQAPISTGQSPQTQGNGQTFPSPFNGLTSAAALAVFSRFLGTDDPSSPQ